MRIPFVVFKDRSDLVEGDKANFLNSIEAVKEYVADKDVAYFVNVKGVSGEHQAPHNTFKAAVEAAEAQKSLGTPSNEIYISVAFQQFASSSDIDF